MAKTDTVKSRLTQTKWHRRCIGDVVRMRHSDYEGFSDTDTEGTITSI
jgi:hypothetical protein